ncbi:energy transducer TonB [Desulfocurvus sp.]|jgi:protein TonB|uniref:energy transducer TonB n=1 Tax=Desulfocurvus sp. TaxID=2871698 RepID=UPI0025BDCCD1|nr:energy transducer TonB [Desulfocurvus sp.]MCK9241182.1 TonB family protein [Desulfocurvus sp.]
MSACACCLASPLPRIRTGGWICGLALALLINAVLFLGIPWLTEKRDAGIAREYEGAVLLAPERTPPPEELEPERMTEPDREPVPPQMPTTAAPPTPAPPRQQAVSLDISLDAVAPDGAGVVVPLSVGAPLSGPRLFEVGEVDTVPRVLRGAPPTYPYHARRQNITGKVVVRFLVDVQGSVSRVSIQEATPKGVFEDSVVQAVQRWRFSPGVLEGSPVNTWVVAPFEFKL